MKAINTIAVVTALLGSLSFSSLAQNATTSQGPVSPNNIGNGTEPSTQPGSESPSTANRMPAKIAGRGK